MLVGGGREERSGAGGQKGPCLQGGEGSTPRNDASADSSSRFHLYPSRLLSLMDLWT